jgi:hypothetical protein
MARALFATALAQALIAVIALIAGLGVTPATLTGFFVALWLGSAWLFRKAARQQTPPRRQRRRLTRDIRFPPETDVQQG